MLQRLFLSLSFLLTISHLHADDLDDLIKKLMQKRHIPGLSLAIIQDGKILKAKAYGFTDNTSSIPVTTNTLFQAGSVSKSVAAAGALFLVEKGKLSLDEDVNTRLKTWKVPDNEFTKDKKVTLRGLLSHTTGLSVHGFPGYEVGSQIPSVVQILDGTAPANTGPVRVDFIPGSNWRYSGGGYTVMQQMILDVTGKSFPAFMKETVLAPLHMQESTYQQPLHPDKAKITATGHLNNRKPVKGLWHIYPEMAAAGLWTTPSDLARFAIGIQNAYAGKPGSLLSQSMAQQMLTDQKNHDGLGVFLQGEGKTMRFAHSGRDEGFDALMTASVEKGQGVVIMINANDNSHLMGQIVDAIANHYHWDGFPPSAAVKHTAVPVNPKQLTAFEGRYELANNRMITFQVENNSLYTLEDGFSDVAFTPITPTRFASEDPDIFIEFSPDQAGNVTGLTWKDRSGERKIPRIGPLFRTSEGKSDPDPTRTLKIKVALEALLRGGKAVEDAPGLTAGARRDFARGGHEADQIKSLSFVHTENVAGRGIQRHDSDVSEIVTYRISTDQADSFVIVHLTSDGLVTDCDLINK